MKTESDCLSENVKDQIRKQLLLLFYERRQKNTQYSLRALARDFGFDQSHLLKFLKGKKSISASRAQKLAEAVQVNQKAKTSDEILFHSNESLNLGNELKT